jgi:hypothetical protein
MNTSNKKIVIALYRSKIRTCNNLGYSLGKWNDANITHRTNLYLHKIKTIHKRLNMGEYLMDNIRLRYKLYKDEPDIVKIEKLIDNAFDHLRDLNQFANKKH